jgi:NADH:ubiquinone oxidoreductase subunit 6 (subunit J)
MFEPANILSILVSAAFLKMTVLVDEALKFAHDNMNKILAVTNNLNCLGEPLISRYLTQLSFNLHL